MALVNTEWLLFDAVAKRLIEDGQYVGVSDSVDSRLRRDFANRGISDIPLDGIGYIDNDYLRDIATHYALFTLLYGVSNVRDTDNDVIGNTAGYYEQQYRISLSNLNLTMVV